MDMVLDKRAITLDSRFADLDQPVLLTGIQALMRLLLEQKRLDKAAGLNTAGFVSGYRGSPLGMLDRELWVRKKLMAAHDIRFEPGINEDLAATMLLGTQELDAFPGKKFDGVFGMWYGKGPGVDRAGDAFHCANMAGTHPHGGVLAVSGDDHGAHSSTYPHQTEYVFQNVFMPVLNPGSVQDVLDMGLAGWALSRYSGLWVAMKTTAETMEQAATAIVRSAPRYVTPDHALPPHGLSLDHTLRFPAERAELERRLVDERLPAAMAWMRANPFDKLIRGAADAPIGLITVGKAHEDTMHALKRMGIDQHPQLAIYKIGMTWPLEIEGIKDFARGKRFVLVIEEKRGFVETQIRDALYHMPADERPDISGKTTPRGEPLLSPLMELSPESIGVGMTKFLGAAGLNLPDQPAPPVVQRPTTLLKRVPAFCAGCPHATSTKLPDGSFASAGIGCHFMAQDDGPQTRTFTHMGGEGAPFVGLSDLHRDVKHMFANIGDGTYQHSGSLAIRQAAAAGTRMTYKLLYNDAVAMTGGQPVDGGATVPMLAAQIAAEGVKRIAIVADEAERLPPASALPPGVTTHIRADLDAVQRSLRDYEGTSVLIYDQVCATEKRRRRRRGTMAQATRHVVINEAVCENCGDCSTQSGCIAIEPVETPLGRKRRINQSACNVDLSCLKGFCPSFVTLPGAPVAPAADGRWQAREGEFSAGLPEPVVPSPEIWRGLFAGIGGGGIVTAGAVLAMAAHLEGRHVKTLDFTGMAQKNGAVVAHVQISTDPDTLDVVRIPLGGANLMLAADLAVGCSPGVLERNAPDAIVIGNLDLAASADFKRDALLSIDAVLHRRTIEKVTDAKGSIWLHGVQLAERLFGNTQAMNTLLLGLAWQRGLVPVGREAIARAIELNGAEVALNQRAFLWGRILATRPQLVSEILGRSDPAPLDLPALIEARAAALVEYQDAAYAARYRSVVQEVQARETAMTGSAGRLTRAAAEGLFRVMAYKDEYEVARLHALAPQPAGAVFHMSPPLITRIDPRTGRRNKVAIPGWVASPLFRLLRRGKAVRGTALDLFGRQAERRAERALIEEYIGDLRTVAASLRVDTMETAVAIASLPDEIRGFGPVKDNARAKAAAKRRALLAALNQPAVVAMAAE